MSLNIVAIIQARMGSSRLPQKVMMEIQKKPILEHVIERVNCSKMITNLVVATTDLNEDDQIASFVKNLKFPVFRGNSTNVLDRFYHCAKKFNADVIVRISADSPLIDAEIIDKCISQFQKNVNADYLSNTINRKNNLILENYNGFPIGVAVEVFSFDVLQKVWVNAKTDSDKEHVTEYIWKHENLFNLDFIEYSKNKSDLRLVIDYKEDFVYVKKIIETLNIDKLVSLEKILEMIDKNSSILHPNLNSGD